MINNIQICNFKCWKDTGKVKLSPITVFFGENSSGKSSIGQFLMMLKQTVEYSDRKAVFYTGNENTAVDLGLPSEMIYNKDKKSHLLYAYDWSLGDKLEIMDSLHGIKKSISHIEFRGDAKIVEKSQAMEVESLEYGLEEEGGGRIDLCLKKIASDNGGKKGYELSANNYELKRMRGRAWGITAPVRFYGFPDEAVAYFQNADFLQRINLYHERLFDKLYYLGPLRNKAKRLYTWLGGKPRDVGTIGEDAVSALLATRDEERLINLRNRAKRKTIEAIVAEMLKKMELIDEFSIHRISPTRQDYEVKVRAKGSKNDVDIPDVGVGVSQVLPVIVELFYAPAGSTIIIEQPELHLHPNAQAHLADVMIDAIRSKEDGAGRNLQIIIESHSEHFLRRLQRRVAEGFLDKDELSAYFINYAGKARLEELQIDEYGDILNWPSGFFGDIQGDIFSQAKAGISKRMEGIRE